MPLSINIGLSTGLSRDFQSTGVSVNLTAALDATVSRQSFTRRSRPSRT
jgi:hypothetical protein